MLRADSRHKCHGKLQESGLPRARTRGSLALGAQDPNRQPTIANQPSARTAQPSATVEALRGTAGALVA
jgi:hypothetical protein